MKAFAENAAAVQAASDLGTTVISDEILAEALQRPDGIRDIVRRVHPYTLQALAQRDRFSLHAEMHENVYYALYARKMLGQLPEGGIPIINFDPHSDAEHRTGKTKTNWDEGTGVLVVKNIKDSNWAAAALKDGLAPYVIGIEDVGDRFLQFLPVFL